MDSTRFTYSGGRGSAFNFLYLNYMTEYEYPTNREDLVAFDSMSSYAYLSGQMVITESIGRVYHSGNKPASADRGYRKDLWFYNATGLNTRRVSFYPDANNIPDTLFDTYYLYDAQNRVVRDSTLAKANGSWVIDQKIDYTYNSMGKMTEKTVSFLVNGNWQPATRLSWAYTATGQMMRNVYAEHNGLTWVDFSKDSFGYSGNHIVYRVASLWNGTAWNAELEEVRQLNSSGLPQSIARWDPFNPGDTTFITLTYTAGGSPATLRTIQNTTDQFATFYYENYIPVNIIEGESAELLHVYPNPSEDGIFVIQAPVSHGFLEVWDAGGRIVLRSEVGNPRIKIDLTQHSGGIYYFRLKTATSGYYGRLLKG